MHVLGRGEGEAEKPGRECYGGLSPLQEERGGEERDGGYKVKKNPGSPG